MKIPEYQAIINQSNDRYFEYKLKHNCSVMEVDNVGI